MPYDNETSSEGRSKEVDSIARAALKEVKSKEFTVNTSDPVNNHVGTNQGNPDDPAYNKSRKLGG
jgi:hypothetical protein